MSVIEERLQTQVKYECDVLVCGGGVAGIAAAIAAARQGSSVILTERVFMLGGLATAGLVTIYLPLCDGYGRQVSFSLAEELLRLSVKEFCDGERGANEWLFHRDRQKDEKGPRFEVNFNPNLFAISAEELLCSLGVKILYGTTVSATKTENGKITAVIAENKSGRFAIKPKSVVDATGDADLAACSGAPTVQFKQGNVLASWYYFFGQSGYGLKTLGFADIPDEEKTDENAPKPLVARRFSGLDGEEISEQTILSHQSVMNDFKRVREGDSTYQPVTIASIPQIRMTRRIAGDYTLLHTQAHEYFEDSIGMVSNWKRRGPVYEVPFKTLYSSAVKNLIFAGRCTSTDETLWDVMRVIPCCAVTGEAAGVAAALCDDFTTLSVPLLQEKLRQNGVVLHENEL